MYCSPAAEITPLFLTIVLKYSQFPKPKKIFLRQANVRIKCNMGKIISYFPIKILFNFSTAILLYNLSITLFITIKFNTIVMGVTKILEIIVENLPIILIVLCTKINSFTCPKSLEIKRINNT